MIIIIIILAGFLLREPIYRHYYGVSKGVMFLDLSLEGYLPKEVTQVVTDRKVDFYREPVNAHINLDKGLIPEIYGYRLDVDATVNTIMEAAPGDRIEPVLQEWRPLITKKHFPAEPIYRGNPLKNQVALQINVAWGEEHLEEMLDILQKGKAGATFFLVGRWMEKNLVEAEKIWQSGFELESHGYRDDIVYPDLSPEEMQEDLTKIKEMISGITGKRVRYFAPHKGEFDDMTLEMVHRQGLRTIMWSLDTVDWQNPGVEVMVDKVKENVQAGDIILMHPTADTCIFLEKIIPFLHEKKLEPVGVGELLEPSLAK